MKPPEATVVMVDLPLLPWATEAEVGDAEIVKAGAVTIKVTVAVWVMFPPVPVTVIGYEPGVVLEATAIFIVEVPEPEMDVGLKVTVTPVG